MELTDRDRRTLKYGGIIAGVLLLGILAMNLLGGGEEVPPPTGGARPTQTSEPTQTPTDTGTPTSTFTPTSAFTGRDPFSIPPIFQVSPTGSPTSPTGSPTSPTGSPTSPTGSPTSPSPTQTPTQPGGGSSTNVGGHEVVLLDVFVSGGVDRVQVEVDGTVYDVQEGETFAGGEFELRSVSGNCATFVFGDEQFTLCVTPSK